jgi:hypothetical protein
MIARVFVVAVLTVMLAAPAAFAWKRYPAEYNATTGWPGIRVTDDNDHVVAVISFLTPDASFSVTSITFEETMDVSDIANWNHFYEKKDPVIAKRVNGTAQALKVSRLKIFDYLTEEGWDACGGDSAFVNGQVRIFVGYLKGTKYKAVEIKEYQADPAGRGVTFEVDAIKEITEMGPVCWGYWAP